MATRTQYGKTWWGKAWLNALSACDYTNRLPRGKTYCNSGHVLDVNLNSKTHEIEAVVQGSVYPYDIRIKLPTFTETQIQTLIETLKKREDLLARLFDKELPPEINDICLSLGLKLFPSSSRDIEMDCSCPDRAIPCKHIAAVIYWLSRQIDKDPFLIFALHGLYLLDALQAQGLEVKEVTEDRPTTLQSLSAIANDIELPQCSEDFGLTSLPLTPLPVIGKKIFSLLPEQFSLSNEKNFRAKLLELIRKNDQKARRLFSFIGLSSSSDQPDTYLKQLEEEISSYNRKHFHFAIDKKNLRDFALVDKFGKSLKKDDALRLINALISLPESNARLWLRPQLYALRVLFLATDRLYRSQALISVAVVSPKSEDCWPQIYWMPAIRYSQIGRAFAQICVAFDSVADDVFELDPIECSTTTQKMYLGMTLALTYWHRLLSTDFSDADGGVLFTSPSTAELSADVKPSFANEYARYLRILNLTFNFPWKPVVSLTRSRDKAINVHFCIKQKDSKARAVDLKLLMKEERYQKERFAALNVLNTLKPIYPLFGNLVESKTKTVKLASDQLKDFLFEIAPVLTLLGISLSMPASLKKLLRPRLTASISSNSSSKSFFSKDALTDFDFKLAIGDQSITEEELSRLLNHVGEVIEWGDQYIYVDPEEIERYREKSEHPPKATNLQKMRAVLTGETDGIKVSVAESIKRELEAIRSVDRVDLPATLCAKLRPYQRRGYEWLMKNIRFGFGSLIADDMGLGKTLQVIACITRLKEEGSLGDKKVLVVVPTTLLTNWEREIAKFSPSLRVALYHGAAREMPAADTFDVLITSYGLVRRDLDRLSFLSLKLLVVDEAQAVKNHLTTLARSLSLLKADEVIAMSGTPVENHLMEYWSIFSLVQPGLLGSERDFKRTFATPIESERDPQVIEAFKALTAPFMLRRLKTDKSIINDLPERIVNDQFVTLTPEQAALYQKTLNAAMKRLEKIEAQAKAEDSDLRMQRRAAVLKLITSLKQICNSPSQYLQTEGQTPDSGKAALLFELLEQNFDSGRKVLIFTQYREMGDRLKKWITDALDEKVLFINGSVPVKKRMQMVDDFQTDPTVRVMVLSLKAAGTGLNLTAASSVIHYDLWWNPAVEAQATDRAYRIGQKNDVLVYRFVTAGTFEERINDMLASKRELAELTVNAGETWVGDLSTGELKKLFALDK